MKHFKTGLLAGASVLAMTAHAHSAAAIGNLIITAALGLGAGGLLPVASAAAIGLGAIGAGLAAANLAATFLNRPKANPQDIKNTSKGSEGPGHYAFGRVELGGQVGFGNTAGYSLYRLIFHCFGEIDAAEEYIYDGREIVVDAGTGDVQSPPWTRPGGSYLRVQTQMGSGAETAWPELISAFPTLWSPEHRARGIGQSLLRAINPGTGEEIFPRLYQGGLKDLRAVARVTRCFDPRDGQTRWTDNAALVILHFLRRLPTTTDAMINFTLWSQTAEQADALVPTATGTRRRARLCGGWRGPLTTDIIVDMLESAGMELVADEDGRWYPRFIEDAPEPEIVLRSRHIIDIDYKSGPDGAKRSNIAKGKFFSAERHYEVAELDLTGRPWARVPSEIVVHGDQEQEFNLVFCPDHAQAQPIIRRLFHMARADFGSIITTFAGLAAWGRRTALIEFPDIGPDGESVFKLCRIGTVRPSDADGTCEIPFQVIPDILKTPWNPATMEAPPPPVLPRVQYESTLATPVISSGMAVVRFPDGSHQLRARMQPVPGAAIAEGTFRSYSGSQPGQWQAMSEAGLNLAYATVTEPGQFDFRYRYFDADEEGSYFSPVLSDTLAIDDTPVDAPALFGGLDEATNMVVLTATAPSSLNVATMDIGTGRRPAVPGQSMSWSFQPPPPGSSNSYAVIARTSNGTATTSNSVTVTTPRDDV